MTIKDVCYYLGIVSGIARHEAKYGHSKGDTIEYLDMKSHLSHIVEELSWDVNFDDILDILDFVNSLLTEMEYSKHDDDLYERIDGQIFDFISNL